MLHICFKHLALHSMHLIGIFAEKHQKPGPDFKINHFLLCPFAVYYLRYGVRSFFTMSRFSLADGKTAGQKVHRKIAVAVQKVKTYVLFIPLF